MSPGACSFDRCKRRWYLGRCCGWGWGGGRFGCSMSAIVLVEYVSRLHSVGRHRDKLAAYEECRCFIRSGFNEVGATVRRL
jgi:hypothetical protein